MLRAYCDTNMIIAESKGKISHPYMQFIMGHKGDIEARYSTNKGATAHYDRGYAKSLQRMRAIPKHGNITFRAIEYY